MRLSLLLLFLFVFSSFAAGADLETLLANMDSASEDFEGLKADVRWVKYTAIVDDKSVESGVIKVQREKKDRMNLLIEFQDPYPYFVSVQGTKVEIYRPRIATVEQYDLSKSQDMLQQALLLGFGTAGRFLRENYDIQLRGEEEAAGQQTVKIELIPKSEKMRQNVPRLEMWVSKDLWQPVQQKLYGRRGDYRLYTYSNIVLNPPLKNSDLRLKIPKGVKRVFPQR